MAGSKFYPIFEECSNRIPGCKKKDATRKKTFERLDCSDFGPDAFDDFYFSRMRRSLDHHYPQVLQSRNESLGQSGPTWAQIKCFANFAMIGHDMNNSSLD